MLFSYIPTLIALLGAVNALGGQTNIAFQQKGSHGNNKEITLHDHSSTATLFLDQNDWPGVNRAAEDLSDDFRKVTGHALPVSNYTSSNDICKKIHGSVENAIIIGTIGNNTLIQNLIKEKKINVDKIKGKWESYIQEQVENPVPCIKNALVIAGSDKRGAIFGAYDISEQIGVSPWYYFADVVPQSHDSIYFSGSKTQGEPGVKYRGIFINDEQPAIAAWVAEFFPEGKYNSYFVHQFYVKLFECLLRMRANYLWPAMWASMFGVDDPENQYWADYYGVVMATSHTEPLMRATNEWSTFGKGAWDYSTNKDNIVSFWKDGIERSKPFENVWTMGIRGFGDTPISGGVETSLLEDVIATQRELLGQYFGNSSVTDIPQSWCLYKEVQSYYEAGMPVPDDITLLWVDDNWGNIRRLPLNNETSRSGGAGVYYHFDYVGDPVDYKWINTISNEKTWEQMHLAKERGADRIWLVNVGDIKPLEVPIEYFISLGYHYDVWGPINKVFEYTEAWAQREFGQWYKNTTEIADIVDLYGFLINRKKYESLNATTYAIYNYQEADTVLQQWSDLSARAWNVYNQLPKNVQPSFFQLVLHPVNAGYIVHDIMISAGKNNVYAEQRRNQANSLATYVQTRFGDDHSWKNQWDSMLNGKWHHMMDQTHLGYFFWQQPMRDVMPPVSICQADDNNLAGAMGVTVDQSRGSVPGDDLYNAVAYSNNTLITPPQDPYTGNTFIEIFNRGNEDVNFKVSSENDFVTLSQTTGYISATNDSIWNSVKVWVEVDWSKAPEGSNIVFIDVTSNTTYGFFGPPQIHVPINKNQAPTNFKGFIEAGEVISIEAEHFSKKVDNNKVNYEVINRYGRTLSGVTLFPVTADSQTSDANAPHLEYDFYSFSTPAYGTNITVYTSPSLNTYPARPLKYAIAIDDEQPQEVQLVIDTTNPLNMPDHWEQAASDTIWLHNTTHNISSSGQHTLKLWALEPGVVFQKAVIDFGGVVPSFLGPPETYRQQ
ncbi:uncharacterized protein SPAPADRAFT_158400 [Spathaspora passalidarum NRRL Y-27907]|uniref:Gylcosyl hydrolase 115 C-terminal domain-containing protein n=1 Tax=Spathaspora passalidarum (strain NRRL Y-27907 / 11-Y1) TaxID=619300 RepID=G3AUV1_SPAPN|nr:uncharacterized protein SPAPADRAFT_158400 [Spathaspora passalidarum NRRL Y-27907]EGW30042.1 hypothetical protein SPAPADRAFT_158400 [Spathaspora passalidarum NRRL Y-27907]